MSSYLDLANCSLDKVVPDVLFVGDTVYVGLNTQPCWKVVAIDGETAWIRRTDKPEIQGLSSIARLSKVEPQPALEAA